MTQYKFRGRTHDHHFNISCVWGGMNACMCRSAGLWKAKSQSITRSESCSVTGHPKCTVGSRHSVSQDTEVVQGADYYKSTELTPGIRAGNQWELKWDISSWADPGEQKSQDGLESLLSVYVVMPTSGDLKRLSRIQVRALLCSLHCCLGQAHTWFFWQCLQTSIGLGVLQLIFL